MNSRPNEPDRLEQQIATVERTIIVVRAIAIGLVVAGLIIGLAGSRQFGAGPDDLSRLGSFLQGTTGVLWGLAGLTLVYVAFLGQQLQILHQKEDLRLTREAFMQQQAEMELQTEEFENQRFDATFFALLGAHQDLVKSSEIDTGRGPKAGAEAFNLLLSRISERYREARLVDPSTPSLEVAKRVYLEEFRTYEGMLGPYFHSLYHIIKFVDDRQLPVERADERKRYTNFVRARLSFSELIVLFYGGLSEQGAGMRGLIERHALLKHLSSDRLLDPDHLSAYRPSAYARTPSKARTVIDKPAGPASLSPPS
jgi:Putative phage abortive infection protein